MAIRTITFTVGSDLSVTPSFPQSAGVQGDHNETELIFKLPDNVLYTENRFEWYLEIITGCGSYDQTEILPVSDKKVSFLIPREWTQDEGVATISLVGLEKKFNYITGDRDLIGVAHTFEAQVSIASRQKGTQRVKFLITQEIKVLSEMVRNAVENIKVIVSGSLADCALKILEQNKMVGLGLWIGSSEEYRKLPKEPNNTAVLITDDPMNGVAEIENGGTGATTAPAALQNLGVADYIVEQGMINGWTYRKWASGIAEMWLFKSSNYSAEYDNSLIVLDEHLPFELNVNNSLPVINASGFHFTHAYCYVTYARVLRDESGKLCASVCMKCANREALPEQAVDFSVYVMGMWK